MLSTGCTRVLSNNEMHATWKKFPRALFHAAIQSRISTLNACVRCSHTKKLICVMLLHIIITCKSSEHLLLAFPYQLLRQRIQNAFKPFREFMSARLRLLFGVVGLLRQFHLPHTWARQMDKNSLFLSSNWWHEKKNGKVTLPVPLLMQ